MILTIAIPTFNRGRFLEKSLELLVPQVQNRQGDVELYISDNCSSDNTEDIVAKFMAEPGVHYLRNNYNLGMDGNFLQCAQMGSGRYIWVLGDDDYLESDALDQVVEILANHSPGLLHLRKIAHLGDGIHIEMDLERFLGTVSYWITFISCNIFRRDAIGGVNPMEGLGTYISLVPLYLKAAATSPENVLYSRAVLTAGNDRQTNGGYNYFTVFVQNYLSVCHRFQRENKLTRRSYLELKKALFKEHVLYFFGELLLKNHRGNFQTSGAWKVLFKFYGSHSYFYFSLFVIFIDHSLGWFLDTAKKIKRKLF